MTIPDWVAKLSNDDPLSLEILDGLGLSNVSGTEIGNIPEMLALLYFGIGMLVGLREANPAVGNRKAAIFGAVALGWPIGLIYRSCLRHLRLRKPKDLATPRVTDGN